MPEVKIVSAFEAGAPGACSVWGVLPRAGSGRRWAVCAHLGKPPEVPSVSRACVRVTLEVPRRHG